MDYAKHIADLQHTRAEKSKRMKEIHELAAAEGRTKDEAEAEEFKALGAEIQQLDVEIADSVSLKALEDADKTTAKPVEKTARDNARRPIEPGVSLAPVSVKDTTKLEPGIAFAQFAMALHAGRGSLASAKAFAQSVFPNNERLNETLKAAVEAGTTSNPTWAGNLVDYRLLANEFLEYLTPRTLVGRFGVNGVPSLRMVPFNIEIAGQTGGAAAGWVGEGWAKPVTKATFDKTPLGFAKIAAISVITAEVDRFSEPSVQRLVRDDLSDAVIRVQDRDFIDPGKASASGQFASPASITYGITPIPSSATDAEGIRCEINELWSVADDADLRTDSAVYITDTRTARGLSSLRGALGQREFPDLTAAGGSIDGVPVLVTNHVPRDSSGSLFILAFASEILLADDGVVTLDTSTQASVLMDSAPNMNSVTPTGSASLVSLWQTNSIGIKAEKYVNWRRARSQAVAYLDGVNWVCQPSSP